MAMIKVGSPLNRDRKTNTGRREITVTILDTIVRALVEGDWEALSWVGVSPAMAKQIYSADRNMLAELIQEHPGMLRVEFNECELEACISSSHAAGLAPLWRRQLIDLGATWEIVYELGLGIGRPAFADLLRTAPSDQTYRGKPKTLTLKQTRALHAMCECTASPERIHPIEHLIQAAHHLDIRIAGIWRYLNSESYAGPAPAHYKHKWIYIMFPEWDIEKSIKSQIPLHVPRFDYINAVQIPLGEGQVDV